MKEEFLKKVSLELKIIRLEHNDKQADLSKKSSVAMSTISKYEGGTKNMNLNKIEEILKPYGINLNIFFNRILAKTQTKEVE